MDHLATSEERRQRWHATHIEPKSVWFDGTYNHEEDRTFIHWIELEREGAHTRLNSLLDRQGYVVIQNILTEKECQWAERLAWDWIEDASRVEQALQEGVDVLETQPPVQRYRPETHTSPYFPKSLEGGIMPFYGAGHSTFAWRIRSHKLVRKVFEVLYGTDDLMSSMDGIVAWPRHYQGDRGWFHVDQNPRTKPQRASIQGFVNVLSEPTIFPMGNVLVKGSHRLFPEHYTVENHECSEFYRDRLDELGGEDWLEIDPNDTILLQPEKVISIELECGDMLLWDSRVVHCSHPPPPGYEAFHFQEPTRHLFRLAALVTMMPSDQVPPEVVQERLLASRQLRTLTHWVNKAAPLGEEDTENARLEARRVELMLRTDRRSGIPILRDFDHLGRYEQELVVGKQGPLTAEW